MQMLYALRLLLISTFFLANLEMAFAIATVATHAGSGILLNNGTGSRMNPAVVRGANASMIKEFGGAGASSGPKLSSHGRVLPLNAVESNHQNGHHTHDQLLSVFSDAAHKITNFEPTKLVGNALMMGPSIWKALEKEPEHPDKEQKEPHPKSEGTSIESEQIKKKFLDIIKKLLESSDHLRENVGEIEKILEKNLPKMADNVRKEMAQKIQQILQDGKVENIEENEGFSTADQLFLESLSKANKFRKNLLSSFASLGANAGKMAITGALRLLAVLLAPVEFTAHAVIILSLMHYQNKARERRDPNYQKTPIGVVLKYRALMALSDMSEWVYKEVKDGAKLKDQIFESFANATENHELKLKPGKNGEENQFQVSLDEVAKEIRKEGALDPFKIDHSSGHMEEEETRDFDYQVPLNEQAESDWMERKNHHNLGNGHGHLNGNEHWHSGNGNNGDGPKNHKNGHSRRKRANSATYGQQLVGLMVMSNGAMYFVEI